MRSSLLLVVILAAACGGKAKTTTPIAGSGGTPSAAAAAVTLKELQNGDAACYVVVVDGTEEKSLPGDFELCKGGAHDASALIGKRVTFTTEKQNVLAASCQGDVDCGKSDQVDLVTTITAAP